MVKGDGDGELGKVNSESEREREETHVFQDVPAVPLYGNLIIVIVIYPPMWPFHKLQWWQ